MRLVHLVPVIVVIAAVTAGLRMKDEMGFLKEFAKAAGSLIALYVGLAVVIFAAAWLF